MRVIHYPHPALLRTSKPLKRVDAGLRKLIAEMFDLMYGHKGIGLAANQVDLPYRLFVMNESGDPKRKEDERVFINPVLSKPKGSAEREEGCLSLPGLYADVKRSAGIVVEAFDLDGQLFRAELDELGARAVQHEIDHLDGILFIDRLDDAVRQEVAAKVDEFAAEYARRQSAGEIPTDDELRARLQRLATRTGVPAIAE